MLSCRVEYSDDGERRALVVLQADPLIEVADQVLDGADPEFLDVGDGIMTVHASNGEVTYGLCEHDDLRETWLGVRSGTD